MQFFVKVMSVGKEVGVEPEMLDDLSQPRPSRNASQNIQARRRDQETNLPKPSLEILKSTPFCILADKSKSQFASRREIFGD
jgi:hypothetical protein